MVRIDVLGFSSEIKVAEFFILQNRKPRRRDRLGQDNEFAFEVIKSER